MNVKVPDKLLFCEAYRQYMKKLAISPESIGVRWPGADTLDVEVEEGG